MGLHNLESQSLFDIASEFADATEMAQAYSWLDELLSNYGSIPNAPGSTQAELAAHLLSAVRGFYVKVFHRKTSKLAEKLYKVIEQNESQRLGIFIEIVDSPSMDETLARYTVWKGTLFEAKIPDPVVCWHPDKDYKPVGSDRVYRTAYSALGRRRRRRETRPKDN